MGVWKLPAAMFEFVIGSTIVLLHLVLAARLERPARTPRDRPPELE